MEGLLSPRTSLRTLSEARFAQDGTGALLLERTTLFAEAQCTLGDRRLRLLLCHDLGRRLHIDIRRNVVRPHVASHKTQRHNHRKYSFCTHAFIPADRF